ncbi:MULTISPECIES: PBECR2 nuclease fold domain-containing protein [unclassified Facklamia]|uniref:PBECR3 domain-containing polyvalent protein n=1 Tax=Aerococcaceae TaxID=186827 RepID=UPI0013B99761|nr:MULTISPECIES: PBECR2 nuclease fold domain-containing protein [unclassified Facklamia]NEW63516.1 hypothetical protein [Facklamia sp. 252]NEW66987.1 hypothetical protein [Facklamia sp. 253]QQD64707.1 hypothetical protein JDW14_05045 [Aerococcaceae bacterium zg-252]
MDSDNHIFVGKISDEISKLLNVELPTKLVFKHSEGLRKHVERRHPEAIKYLSVLDEILNNPDFVGVGSDKDNLSLEFVKEFDDNVLMALKLHTNKEFYYIPSVYPITEKKLKNRTFSGRLKRFDKKWE